MSQANNKIQTAFEEWHRARKRVQQIESELRRAECDASNLERALGKVIAPADIEVGEKIGIWCRVDDHQEVIVLVERREGFSDHHVSIRKQAKT